MEDPRVFFTYSVWDSPSDLEAYRTSDVFADVWPCLLYTSDAADERSSVDLGGRRIIKKKKRAESDGGGWSPEEEAPQARHTREGEEE